MTSESSVQSYFLENVPHGYRTALITGGGFPDTLLIKGAEHCFVEVKLLPIGPSGDRTLKGVFKKTQPPWYMEYLAKGGSRLFILFRLEKKYGILRVTKEFMKAFTVVRYRELAERYEYKEYNILKELIHDYFE